MNADQIISLLKHQQKNLDELTYNKKDPDHKYYLGMSDMIDLILMRIEYGE